MAVRHIAFKFAPMLNLQACWVIGGSLAFGRGVRCLSHVFEIDHDFAWQHRGLCVFDMPGPIVQDPLFTSFVPGGFCMNRLGFGVQSKHQTP
jgi:hypothetical protein